MGSMRATRRALLLLGGASALAALCCCSAQTFEFRAGMEQPPHRLLADEGMVRDVLAGDLIDLWGGERIRLADVDVTPADRRTAEAAREYVARRILGKKILIHRFGVGRYGRTVARGWAAPLAGEGERGEPVMRTLGEELVKRDLGRPRHVGRYVWGTSDGAPATIPPELRAKRDEWWERHTPYHMIPGKPVGDSVMPRFKRRPGDPEHDPTRWP